jgi:radical SAM protein with 4Fe4S-binding SPASM domain
MQLDTESILYKPELHRIKAADAIILIDPKTPNWVAVNSEGDKVLELCNRGKTAKDIFEELRKTYPQEDLYHFVEAAIKSKIIGTTPFSFNPYNGRSDYIKPESLSELWLYVTNRCNLRCKHCLVKGGEDPVEELSLKEFKEVIREAKELGAKRVFLTGGEPFLRDDIFDLIEYASVTQKLEPIILTNGTLLDEEKIKELKNYPDIIVQVSLEGSTASVNDSIRGSGVFDKALKSIDLLTKFNVKTIVTSTATSGNIDEIPRLSDILHQKKAQAHHILWLHRRGRARENNVSVTPEEISNLMRRLKDKKIKVDNWENFKARVRGGKGIKVDGCHAGYSSLCIDSNGDVYPCPSLNGNRRFRIGSLNDGLKRVWLESMGDEELRGVSVIDIEGCRKCEFRFFCGGGCRCQAYYGGEKPDILAKDPYCRVIKDMLIESILSVVSQNGHGKPEIIGHMAQGSSCDSGRLSTSEVTPFRCTCVLDVKSDKYPAIESRYKEAARNPKKELCCPTGYSDNDLQDIPTGTISISYGCGNPTAFADLREGDTVLDLGSGGGIDCFIAAKKVGKTGSVIGVDMTDAMLEKALENNEKMTKVLGYDVVGFRKGLMEDLPVESNSIDLAISNCVINLSPDKNKVFGEIFRVLKNWGRLSISDIVSNERVTETLKDDDNLWSGCISGALTMNEFLSAVRNAGFKDVTIEKSLKWKKVEGIEFFSVNVKGVKP